MSLEFLGSPSALRDEAVEVAWLLGAPFLIQLLIGAGGAVSAVLAGLMSTSSEGQRVLDENWRVAADSLADMVLAVVPGEEGPSDFSVVARALGNAARAVRQKGRIVLLTERKPVPGASDHLFSQGDTPDRALELLRRDAPADAVAAYLWLSATQRATVFLLSLLPEESAANLFVTPLSDVTRVPSLVPADAACLILPDADRTLVDIQSTARRPTKRSG
jgi:hypothetical protein